MEINMSANNQFFFYIAMWLVGLVNLILGTVCLTLIVMLFGSIAYVTYNFSLTIINETFKGKENA
jgi:hypothetical protein